MDYINSPIIKSHTVVQVSFPYALTAESHLTKLQNLKSTSTLSRSITSLITLLNSECINPVMPQKGKEAEKASHLEPATEKKG